MKIASLRTKFIIAVLLIAFSASAKEKDQVIYKDRKNFYGRDTTVLSLDFSSIKYPASIDAFHPLFHLPPIRQDTTGTCWSFSAVSFFESELNRMHGLEIPLSRMYIVYWEYVEKVRRYVREKAESLVDQGSQHNAVIERMKQYGIVRQSDYSGLLEGRAAFDHRPLLREIRKYLDYVKENQLWHEDQVIANVKNILNRYMGEPPAAILFDGKEMSPLDFFQSLDLPLDDYVLFMSFKKIPFWKKDAYDVPDNWWKSKEFHNVPLDDFYAGIKSAIKKGFSLALAGDVSEPGKDGYEDLAIVPTFDIPAEYINQDSREFRFNNKTSTDDHGVHLIGYTSFAGQDWFLIKDSSASAWKGRFLGYHFFSGDYIRLKILAFMVHKDGVPGLMEKFESETYHSASIQNR